MGGVIDEYGADFRGILGYFGGGDEIFVVGSSVTSCLVVAIIIAMALADGVSCVLII